MADAPYGLWPLVVLNTLLFIVFAASFFHYVLARRARVEEEDVARRFGSAWAAYAARTPRFVPRRRAEPRASHSVTRDDRSRRFLHLFGG
ncbi:methyltransferase family protein [Streptomyces sp. NPDC059690]|uniref:methyltransferase family protein n=1 Tax=Streptomyces sp. NPDC059690 TaxID=3346907 RepID=UPI0036C6FD3B